MKMTSVCSCGWASDEPRAACDHCGQAICPKCGEHALTVACWPGESHARLMNRARGHIHDVLASAIYPESGDESLRAH